MLNKKLKKAIASVTMFATVVCLSGVSMLAIPAFAATAIVDGDIVKTNATNSDGTPSISSLDVYIVKTVGSKKFKRLVLNPNIFASYSHLKWENLKTVSQAEIDVYTTSSLVRVDGNDKVFAITPVTGGDTGAKSWINLTAAQFLSLPQSDPDSIYTINSTDGAAYLPKTDITTVAQLTAFYADGTLPTEVVPPVATGLTVSLSATTPASTTAIVGDSQNDGQGYVPFVKLNFAAGSDGAVKVKTLKLKRSGIPSADTDLSNIQIYDGTTKIADYSSFSSGIITFNNAAGLFTVAAGSHKEITVTGDIADTATNGRNIKLSVEASTDIVTDGATVNGSFPIAGNAMNIADIGVNQLGTAVLATVSSGSGTEPGTTAQELWKFKITGANKKVNLEKIRFTMVGTINTSDLQNIELYQGATKLGATAAKLDDDKTVSFDLSSTPFEINKTAKDFSLKGDIVGGTARTYRFSVQSMDDVTVVDSENDVRIKAGAADSWTVIQAAAETTISTGSLTVVKTPNVATGNIAKGATDQLLASFDFKATGEAIKVTTIYVEANATELGIHDAKLFVDGSQIGTAADLTDDVDTHFAIGNSLIIPAGTTKTVEVRGDVKATAGGDDFTANDTIVIYLSSTPDGGADGNAADYTKTVSMGTASVGAVAGYTRTVKSGVLSTSKNTAVGDYSSTNPVGVAGATNVKLASFVATVGAGEPVYIDDVQIIDASAAFTQVQNVKVKVNGTEIGTTVATPVAATTYTFSANPRIEVAASSNVLIEVYGDLKSGGSFGAGDFIVLDQVSATGKNTSADAKDADNVNGQALVGVNNGALRVSVSGNTAKSALLVMGSTSAIPVADFVFEETTSAEDMTITQLVVKNTLGTDTNLVDFSLWDGAAQVGSTQITSTSGVVTFSGLSVSVLKGQTKTLTVKAKTNSYPNAVAAAENKVAILADATGVVAEGVTSGPQTTTIASELDGNIFEAYRTNLTAIKGTVSGDNGTGRSRSASQEIAQIKLVADTAYTAKLRAATTADALTELTSPTLVAAGTWSAVGTGSETLSLGTTSPIIGAKTITDTNGADTDADDGLKLTFTDTTTDLTAYSKMGMWVRANAVATLAVTVNDDDNDSTASVTTVSGEWQYVEVALHADSEAVSDISVIGTLGSGIVLDIDNVRFYNDSVVVDVTGDLLAGIPSGVAATLKDASSTTKMTGYYSGTAAAGTITLLADSEISVSSSEQVLTLFTSTTGLMKTDSSGVVETLNVGIDLGNASTAGDIRWYDGAVASTSPSTWVSGTSPLSFNFGY